MANANENAQDPSAQPATKTTLPEENGGEFESSTDEEIAKLKTEKTFRKQEEEWIKKREKVS